MLSSELHVATTLIKKLQHQLTLYTDASLPPPETPTPRTRVPINLKGYFWSHVYHVSNLHNGYR